MQRNPSSNRQNRTNPQYASSEILSSPRLPVDVVAPPAPINVRAIINSLTNAVVSWTDINNGTTRYQVERSDDGSEFFIVGNTDIGSIQYGDPTISPGVAIIAYRISGIDPLTGPSSTPVVASLLTAPEDPTDLRYSNVTSTTVTLAWNDNSAFETSFRLQRANNSGFTTGLVESTYPADTIGVVVSGLTGAPATFYFRVRAENSAGQSNWSNTLSVVTVIPNPTNPPTAPSSPSLTILSSSSLRLNWTDNSGDESGFTAQIATNNNFTNGLKTISAAAGAVNATFTALSPATLYYSRVCAFNAAGNSAFTSNVSATTIAATGNGAGPAQPTGLAATPVSPTRVDLTWNAGGDGTETGYLIERSADGAMSWQECGRSIGTSYSDRSAPPGYTSIAFGLQYRILGINTGGVSVPSPVVITTTAGVAPLFIPSAPYSLQAYGHSDTEVFLFWRMTTTMQETQFDIQKSPAGAGTWTSVNVGGSGNSFAPAGYTFAKLTGLSVNTSYDFRVRATNSLGSSSYSSTATVSTLTTGGTWSPTGRNPQVMLNPYWYNNWLAAKANYELNPSNPSSLGGKFYSRLKISADSAGVAPPLVETYLNAQLQAACMYHITGDSNYAQKCYQSMVNKWFTVWGGEGTIVNAVSATTTTIQCTGLALTAANAYKDYKFYFNSGTLLDVSLKAFRVSSSSNSSGVTTLNLNSAMPSLPSDGDKFYMFFPASVDGNNSREYFIEWDYLVDMVWGGLTSDQRKNCLCYGNNVLADVTLGDNVPQYVGNFPLNDSDQLTGNYFGLVCWGLLTQNLGNPRAAAYITSSDANGVLVGGLDATALDRSTVRNQIERYVNMSAGGQWIESRAYDEGTTSLLAEGIRIFYDITGVDHVPSGTSMIEGSLFNLICSYIPGFTYQHVWGDRDNTPDGIHFPNSYVRIATQGGFLGGYDNAGPTAMGVLEYWYNNAFASVKNPYGRAYILINPNLTPVPISNLPVVYNSGPTRATFFHADRSSINGSSFALYGFNYSVVDHSVEWLTDYLLWRKNERTIRHPQAYGDFSIYPQGVNSVLWAGLPCVKFGSAGPVCYSIVANSHVYVRGSTQGDFYALPYYQPPPTALYELTRQVLYVPSTTNNCDIIIDHVRGRASSPRKLPNLSSYRSDKTYIGTVNNSATPTTTTFNGTITDLLTGTGYLNYFIQFTNGALVGQIFKVTAATSAGGTTSFTVQTMPQAPAVGNTFTARIGSQYGNILNANALFEEVHHTLVNPTLNSTDTSWQTAGGQYCRVDHLLPVGFQRTVYNETTDFTNTGAVASELKYQFRITDSTLWPSDTTPQFVRFMNVTSAADVSNTVASQLVQSSSGKAVDAAVITRTNENDVVVMFSAELDSPILNSGFTITWTSTSVSTSIFLTFLNPRLTWSYVLDGGSSTPITVPENIFVKLIISGSGSHTMIVTGS